MGLGAARVLSKRSFTLAGHRTSVALEAEFWAALARLAALDGQTLAQLVVAVDARRQAGEQLASSLRVLALRRANEYISEVNKESDS